MPKLFLDDQPIRRIGWEASPYTQGDLYDSIGVGEDGVTHIDAVEQYLGEYAIVWLQVWKDDKLVGRYNARNIDSIQYFGDDDESP